MQEKTVYHALMGAVSDLFNILYLFRERQASIVLERYFRFEISLRSNLCMLIARMEMGTSRVSGDSDIITQTTEHLLVMAGLYRLW